MPVGLNSMDDCSLTWARVRGSQGLQYMLLKVPIIGWRISEPLHKWIMLVTNGTGLIMSLVKAMGPITVQ